MADQSSSSSSSSSSSYQQYPGSSGSSDNDSNSTQEDSRQPANIFRNDGSFMEIFKKMQQRGQVGTKKDESDSKSSEDGSAASTKETGDSTSTKEQLPLASTKKPIVSLVGKRRGGRVLATGMVKKQRKEPVPEKPPEGGKTDAWSEYMNEVRKYREQSCEEEGKRRPLVK